MPSTAEADMKAPSRASKSPMGLHPAVQEHEMLFHGHDEPDAAAVIEADVERDEDQSTDRLPLLPKAMPPSSFTKGTENQELARSRGVNVGGPEPGGTCIPLGEDDIALAGGSATSRGSQLMQKGSHVLEKAQRTFWDSGGAIMSVAAFTMSMGAVAIALIDGRVPAFELVFIRSGFCFLLTVPIAVRQGLKSWYGPKHLWPYLATRGFVGAASMALYYEAIERMPLADAMTIAYSNPVLVAILAWAVRGETLGLLGSTGVAVTLLGVAFVAQPPFLFGGDQEWSHQRMAGALMAFLSAICAAVAYFMIGFIPRSEPSLIVALWYHTGSIILSGLPLLVGYPEKAVLPRAFDCGMLVMVVLTSFLGQMMLNRSFQIINAAKGSSIYCTQVLYAHIFGVFLLNERETVLGILGSILMACGVVTLNGAKSGVSKACSGASAHEAPPLPTTIRYAAAASSEPEDTAVPDLAIPEPKHGTSDTHVQMSSWPEETAVPDQAGSERDHGRPDQQVQLGSWPGMLTATEPCQADRPQQRAFH